MLARATGWSEAEIWMMPYVKGLLYLHCNMLYQGCNTRWVCMTESEEAELDDKFNTLLKR